MRALKISKIDMDDNFDGDYPKLCVTYIRVHDTTATRSNIRGELFPDLFQMENYFRAKA